MFTCRRHPKQYVKLLRCWLTGSEKGISTLEVLLAIVILGVVAVTFLGSIGTGTQATVVTKEQAVAESLIRSEAEYVKGCGYQYGASEYPVDPTLTIPEGWTVPLPAVVPVHVIDDGMQEVTVSAQYQGETVLSILIYKVAR